MAFKDAKQCTAHKKTGAQCKNPAITGATVCRSHGGAAGQVKAAAKRRLLEAVDPLIVELIRIAESGKSERDRITAIRDVLDRAGLAAPKQIEISVDDARAVLLAEIERLEADAD